MTCVVLRALAEGKIRWAFWPPGAVIPIEHVREGLGIWLGDVGEDHEVEADRSEAESDDWSSLEEDTVDDTASDDAEDEENEDAQHEREEEMPVGIGRFGALTVDEENDVDSKSSA